ncbi:MAG: hypothetical protein ACRDBG_16860 [Waterburya sp.]
MTLNTTEVNLIENEREYLSQFLSDRQKKHLYAHGYDKLLGGQYILYLDENKTKSIPIVRTKRKTKVERVKAAFRKAINPQIKQFRRDNNYRLKNGYYCPISKLRIVNWKQAHVDHIYPFSSLLADFCMQNNLSLRAIDLNRKGEIKDNELQEKWCQYHRLNAKLGILSKEANIRKGALTPEKILSEAQYQDLVPSLEFDR